MLAIIDYKGGNIQSVKFALDRLNVQYVLTDDAETIQKADKVIFPGQGEASTAMRYLKEKDLDTLIPTLKQPFLGICIGMQLLCEYSEENETTCLGIIPQKVLRFEPKLKVPHIGWNTIFDLKKGIFTKQEENKFVYFVHSYYVELGEYTSATCDYISPFSAAIQKDNFFATQFHVEKSGDIGENIIKNFLKI